jgi:hypothetical protein
VSGGAVALVLLLGALVGGLLLLARQLDPIGGDVESGVTPDRTARPVTPRDVPDAWIGWDGPQLRTTPLPHSEPAATGWRARLSRHVASRHDRGSDVAHAGSPDGGGEVEVEARVVKLAPGVHASRPSMDEWLSERIGRAPYTRASLAQGAAREYRCSVRTAQRAIARLISDPGSPQ